MLNLMPSGVNINSTIYRILRFKIRPENHLKTRGDKVVGDGMSTNYGPPIFLPIVSKERVWGPWVFF